MSLSRIIKRIVHCFTLLYGCFLFAAESNRPMVSSITFTGVRYINREVLLQEFPQKLYQPLMFTLDSLSQFILNTCAARGYYLAQIDSSMLVLSDDSTDAIFEFWITEGGRCKVDHLNISGMDSVWIAKTSRFFEMRPGEIFNDQALRNDIEALLIKLENEGFPLALVEIADLRIHDSGDDQSFQVDLKIHPGPLIHIGQIRVEGNQLTRSRVILREVRIPVGSIYREKDIREIRDHLQRLEYFEQVKEPVVRFSGDSAIIILKVKEGQPNTLDGVIGYTPSNDPKRPGYFTGRLNFNFRNFLGTGRFLEAFWEKKDNVSQAMRFGYEEPWIHGWPIHAGWRFEQEIRDTTYVDRGWRISLRYSPSRYLSLRVEGGNREILPDSLGSVIYGLAQSKTWLGTLGFDYTTLDDPVNPSKGVRYHTSATFGRKRNIGPAFLLDEMDLKKRFHTRHIIADAEFIFGLWGRQVLFTGLHGQEVRSGQTVTPLSEQIRFGGATTLRGYTEDAFRGDLVAWMNLEYRFLFSRRSRVFLFCDAGMYQRREEDLELKRGQKIGYGFGIRISTRLGIMGVDYGLGQGDGLMQGKVHVGLINRF